jgi:hypothetical protein
MTNYDRLDNLAARLTALERALYAEHAADPESLDKAVAWVNLKDELGALHDLINLARRTGQAFAP